MAKNNTAFNLSIKMNGKEVKNTLNGVGKELRALRNKQKGLTEGTDDYIKTTKELAEAEVRYDRLKKSAREQIDITKKNIDAQEDHNQALNSFTDGFSQLFQSIKSGDLVGAREGFNGIATGIRGATKAAFAFIATPIGASIAALTSLFIAGREIFNFNDGLKVMNKELRALGVASGEISKVRDEIKATAETFNKDFKQISEKAKSLSESFGISMSEANKVIAQGLADGGAQNEEFLDSLGEYDEFFSKAGFAAQDFADVVNQGFELGIYKDKLPDALKEADLALKEQTAATRDSLVNAFGSTFTDDILDRIDQGKITTKEALEEIATEAEDSGLSMQQQAQLTADVFKGAGEDAGGALKVLEAVGQAADRELSSVAKAELELKNANEELNKAQAELFEVANFGEIWTGIKTKAVQAISGILKFLTFLKTGGTNVAEGVANAFVLMANRSLNTFINLTEKIRPVLSAIGVDVDKLVDKVNSAKFEAFDFSSDDAKLPGTDGEDGANEEAQNKKAEAAKQRRVEEAAAIKKQQELKAKAAEKEKERLEELDKLDAEYIKKKEDRKANSNEEQAKLEMNRALKEAEDLQASKELIDNIEQEHKVKVAEAKKEDRDKELERIREFESRKRELENEIALERAETEEEKRILKAEQEQERKEQKLQKDLEDLKITEEEKNQLVELLNKKHQDKLTQIEADATKKRKKDQRELYEQRQQLINDSLNAAINAVGAETKLGQALVLAKQIQAAKEMAIQLGLFKSKMSLKAAEATADNAAGVSKTAASAPFPANIPLIIGFVAQVAGIISTIKNAASKGDNVKKQGFAKGGFTDGFGMGQTDESGKEVAGVVHKNEYVVPEFVRSMPGVPPILDYLEDKRRQSLGTFAQGGDTSGKESTTSTSTDTGNDGMMQLLERLEAKMDRPLSAEILFGYDAEVKRQEVQKELKEIEQENKVKQ